MVLCVCICQCLFAPFLCVCFLSHSLFRFRGDGESGGEDRVRGGREGGGREGEKEGEGKEERRKERGRRKE